jgi:hypothetical protein
MFSGFQTLTHEQKLAAAHMTSLAGLDFFSASHIWWFDGDFQAVALRLKTGVNVLIHNDPYI